MIARNAVTPAQVRPTQTVAVDRTRLIRSILRDDFHEFTKEHWDTFIQEKPVWNWHIPYLCNELQECCERVIRGEKKKYDLIVNISPGTTKSTLFSVMLLPWVWTRMPHCRMIGGSFTDILATDLSMKSRDLIQSEKYRRYFPDIQLRPDLNNKTHFANTRGGWRLARSVGAAVTGFHAHLLIVDDPLNPTGARSEEEIKTANRWMSETLPSRKVDKEVAFTALVMQRLHQNDPTGHLLDKNPTAYKHVCLPAEETEDIKPAILRERYVDGLMDPKRLSREVLAAARKDLMEYGYAGQFLQTPIPLSGGMFQTGCFFVGPAPPDSAFRLIVRYWDTAGTLDGGAYTAGVKMGVMFGVNKEPHVWVLHVDRFQLHAAAREKRILEVAKMDGKKVVVGVEQQPGSSGKEAAEATVRMLAMHGYRGVTDKPTGDKVQRADVFARAVGAHAASIASGLWNLDFIDELRFFPDSRYKDQTDASSGAFKLLTQRGKRRGVF